MSQTKSYFFNAEPTEDLSSHPTGYDREYDADDHAAFFRPFFSEKGIMAGRDADACKVSVQGGEGTTLQVAAGAVYIRGRAAIFDGTETVAVSQDCKIVCRMNKGADVRAFQLLAITGDLQDTEDVCDLQLAAAHLEAISGGHKVVLTDTRTFLSYMGQPAYYPPDSDSLPYVLWLYTLGFPMDEEQRRMVEGNPSLMAIFNASLGAQRSSAVDFTAAEWTGDGSKTLTIPRTKHGRQTGRFAYTLRHKVSGQLKGGTWAVLCTSVTYDEASGNVLLTCEDAYDGQICFSA